MHPPPAHPQTRDLAEWLLAHEAASAPPEANIPAVSRVCEKMRLSLSTLAGTTGFRALLARALTLAKQEARALDAVHVTADGSIEGFNGEVAEAGVALIARLIALLVTFIGETLTLRLLQDAWPHLPGSDTNSQGTKPT